MNESSRSNNDFDYFYVILKKWKIIFLISIIFGIIGLSIWFFSSEIYKAKSSFSISLNSKIETAYGEYKMKTINPLDYLTLLKSKTFRNKVAKNVGYEYPINIKFDIEKREIETPTKITEITYPKSFNLIVTGKGKKQLVELSDTAFSMFLNDMDKKIQLDMWNYYSSAINSEIKGLTFNISYKAKLIQNLKAVENEENSSVTNSSETNDDLLNNTVDNSLINSLKSNQNGLIISMLLNKENGSKYYKKAILAIEEMELNEMKNDLGKNKMLLSKLNDIKRESSFSSLITHPFSDQFIMLSKPEILQSKNLYSYIKWGLIFFFIGFFVSTSVVLTRTYYAEKP